MNVRRSMGPQVAFCDELHGMKYRSRGETFRDAMNRVSSAMADRDSSSHYHAIREILMPMRFEPAGRIQAAMGAPREVTPFNCYVSGTIPDSFVNRDNDENSSIMHRAEQAATTMRMGGGIGYDFSTLRPRGDLIKKLMSNSTGPVSFMHIYDAVCLATSSSGHRRGAQMGVLRVDHPDILEFVQAKHNRDKLTGFNISVAVTDDFMEAVARGSKFDLTFQEEIYQTVDARELWESIMRSTWDWAEPGVLFIDTINNGNPLWYCEKIAATNPCFTGDTRVWTSTGHRTFADLAASGEDVKVLTQRDDGRLVYRTMRKPRVTQRDAALVEVTLRTHSGRGRRAENKVVRCTPNHKFYLTDGTSVRAEDLRSGQSVSSVYRGLANSKGYLKLHNGRGAIMEHHVPFEVDDLGLSIHAHHIDGDKKNNDPDNLELMPIYKHISDHMKNKNPVHTHPHKNKRRHDITREMCAEMSRMGLTVNAIADRLGCNPQTVSRRLGNHKVISVRTLDYREDVYCGTVDECHKFFVALGDDDGVLVSNCGEQPLPPYGACLLGSFNLVRYLSSSSGAGKTRYSFDFDQLIEDIPTIVRAMDNVIDRASYPLPEQGREARSKRRMGLGVLALANALETMGLPYGSPGFLKMQKRIDRVIINEAYRASSLLAKEKGSFELFDYAQYSKGDIFKSLDDDVRALIRKHGLRNSHLTSKAPTGTISMCADNVSSGIEPVFAVSTQRAINTPDGPQIVTLEDYAYAQFGTVPRTTSEVTAREHVDVLLAASKWTDSAVSKTCNVTGAMPWADFKDIYRLAWEGGAKGCTTFNIDGQRMALLKKGESGEGSSCTIDPNTGARSCE